MALKEDYKDQVLDTSVNVNRTYNVIDRNNRVLYTDVQLRETTVFTEDGDDFGANDVNAITAAINAMFDTFHPIGSLFPTTDSTFNPNSAPGWHGTWERITDCVIYAASDNVTGGIGAIVGSNTHTLSSSELPAHKHPIPKLSGTAKSHGIGNLYTALGDTSFNAGFSYGGINLGGYWPFTGGEERSRHTHEVETNESNTSNNATYNTPIDIRPRRLNSVVWRRVS